MSEGRPTTNEVSEASEASEPSIAKGEALPEETVDPLSESIAAAAPASTTAAPASTTAAPASITAAPAAVRLVGITKRFGSLVANRDVDLTVHPNTVHALVGENGAGKSTLMKILAGVLTPDAGEIWLKGEKLYRLGPREAIDHGIGMVHQHFMLVEPLTVAENVVLGQEPVRGNGLIDMSAARRVVEDLSATYGLPVDPNAVVADLSVGEKQRVEILKVLFRGCRILILDEPTAVLTPGEVDSLFNMLLRLVEQDRTVIITTHKLDEVMTFSDTVTVMRHGSKVAERRTKETSPRELAHLMVGRDVLPILQGQASPAIAVNSATDVVSDELTTGSENGDEGQCPVLEISDLVVEENGRRLLDRVSLEVMAGEVLGIAGVQGNGQTELLEAIAGLRLTSAGAIRIAGEDVTRRSPRDRLALGLAHVPEDRHERGLVLDLSVAENLILGLQRKYSSFGGRVLNSGAIADNARTLIRRFDIRPPRPKIRARSLSGGNQQKIVVARELTRVPKILLAGQPTRGVDIGAVEAIHNRLREAKQRGVGLLLVSADLDELMALSDRIAVIHRGRIAAVMPVADATHQRLGELMTGVAPPGDSRRQQEIAGDSRR